MVWIKGWGVRPIKEGGASAWLLESQWGVSCSTSSHGGVAGISPGSCWGKVYLLRCTNPLGVLWSGMLMNWGLGSKMLPMSVPKCPPWFLYAYCWAIQAGAFKLVYVPTFLTCATGKTQLPISLAYQFTGPTYSVHHRGSWWRWCLNFLGYSGSPWSQQPQCTGNQHIQTSTFIQTAITSP